jgi:hypothetical protein
VSVLRKDMRPPKVESPPEVGKAQDEAAVVVGREMASGRD